ncbi:lytic transglycosylase domain-containing protein, partial [Pseudorhodobacter sp.]|uniref:lytic transglycosylase domain-containing protein n=1 Tax=Pseudorhodobacter sp. TaxID=1934400 RepID=UPI00264777EA
MAVAQGVPVIDGAGLAKQIAKLAQQAKDFGVQQDKADTRNTLAEIESEQLATLEKMTAAISGPGYDIAAMESSGDLGANKVYPATPTGSLDARLFGDARETVERMIAQVAGEYAGAASSAGLSPTQFRCLFQALIKQESRFNVTISSPVGAYGLTQLMPGTAADMGVDINDPIQNLRGGAKYITIQLRRFG